MEETTISHYRILAKLGEGGMGVVYKAEDTRLERFVALKFLPEDYAHDPVLRDRFLREARAASALNHPNLCTIYDVGEEDGKIFIAMEFLDGETLKDVVLRGPLPTRRLLEIAESIAEGLEAAHSEGVIHRDIKLANIFVTKNGRTKILDFGLAKKTGPKRLAFAAAAAGIANGTEESQLSSGLAALGTAAYMSPEQALGKPLDERTDLFSFGIVLYEMATGCAPFKGDTTGLLFLSIVQATPELPRELNPEVPEKLQTIIGKCLEKDRDRRYQHAPDIRADLQRLLQTTAARRITTAQPSDKSAPAVLLEVAAPVVDVPTSKPSPVVAAESIQETGASRRSLWKILTAAGAFLAVIVVGTFFYLHSRKVQALAPHAGIVVADFANTTGDPIFDGTLRQALTFDLGQSPFVNIVSNRRVTAALKQMEKPVDTRLSRDIAREVCLRTNSKAYVAGSIVPSGTGYRLEVQALNCENDQTLATVKGTAKDKSAVLRTLNTTDAELRRKLGESLPSVEQFNKPLAEATTNSLEALQAFTTAQDIRRQKGGTEALPYMKHALELDPNFAQAYAVLGATYSGVSEPTLARENLQKAFELRNRVSESERLSIEAAYYDTVTGESDKLIQTCEEWIRLYPGDAGPHARLATQYGARGAFKQMAEQLREAIRLAPDMAVAHTNLVLAYMSMKRMDEAKATYDAARAAGVESENLELIRYDLAFVEGDDATMEKLLKAAKNKPGYQNRLALEWANSEAYFGRFGKARDYAEEAINSAIATDAKESAAEHAAQYALTQAEAGNVAEARHFANEALRLGRGRSVAESAALALARSGDEARQKR